MSTQGSSAQGTRSTVPLDFTPYSRRYEAREARYSRGFLRCRPERWFPAFAGQWLSLCHSLGAELKLVEVKPLLLVPEDNLGDLFLGSIDGEPFGLMIDGDSLKGIIDAVVPGSGDKAQPIVGEYVARRLLATLASSWSGPESSVVQWAGRSKAPQSFVGSVRLTVSLNGVFCTWWMLLSEGIVDRFDGLWRRELLNHGRKFEGPVSVSIELSSRPLTGTERLEPGALLDLGAAPSDQVSLTIDGKPWFSARLGQVDGNFAAEILPGALMVAAKDTAARLSIQLANVVLAPEEATIAGQVGAVLLTETPVSNQVSLRAGETEIGRGILVIADGMLAVQIG